LRARRRPDEQDAALPRLTSQFFTGGVDSFYTLIRRPDVELLIYVHGFDIALHRTDARDQVSRLLADVSTSTGKRVIELESDLRRTLDPLADWGSHVHGAALASTALLLTSLHDRVYIPSTHSYADLGPWGSHPAIDPLWSTEAVQVVHDGAEASRFEKIRTIAQHPVALRNLRVCWQETSFLNCSACEKCLRTMTSLEILGVLPLATTLTQTLDLDALTAATLRNENDAAFARENLAAALEHGHAPIAAAIRTALGRYESRVGER
jgi:hypothetical protein